MTDRRRLLYVSSSYEYTVGIQPFIRRLEARGYVVHWLSFNKVEGDFLAQAGFGPDRVLHVMNSLSEPMSEATIDQHLERFENGEAPGVNQIAGMDRLLRRKPLPFIRRYFAAIEEALPAFLSSRRIGTIISGRDSAMQLSAAKIGKRLSIPFFVPTSYRWPNNFYGFCAGHTERGFVKFRQPRPIHQDQAREFLHEFRTVRPVADTNVFESFNNRLIARLPRDVRLFSKMAARRLRNLSDDVSVYTITGLLKMFLQRRLNVIRLSISSPFLPKPTGRPYVLYGYHAQPESSIDVIAAPFADQPALVRQVAGAVPSTHDFYVKLHPDRIGDLSLAQVKALGQIPGVHVLDPNCGSGRQLMQGASLVVTPAGTMAFEAALSGIPSLVFSDVFFTALPLVHRVKSIDGLPETVRTLVSSPPPADDEAIVDFMADVLANGFVGRFNSYYGDIAEHDLKTMLDAYDELIAWPGNTFVAQ